MELTRGQKTVTENINRLLDTQLPFRDFQSELSTFFVHWEYAFVQEAKNPQDPRPLTRFIYETLCTRIDTAISQREHTAQELAIAQTTRTSLGILRAKYTYITEKTLTEALGGRDIYENYIDREVLAEISRLRYRAQWEKAVLQHRLWMVKSKMEGLHKEVQKIGGLLMEVLTQEGQWKCECADLLFMEQRNRETVIGWLKNQLEVAIDS